MSRDLAQCWKCKATGSALDEFTSPYSGLCAKCGTPPSPGRPKMPLKLIGGDGQPSEDDDKWQKICDDWKEISDDWSRICRKWAILSCVQTCVIVALLAVIWIISHDS